MRRLALLLLIAGIALSAVAAKRVTVEQLEQVLAASHGRPDAKVAQQLSNLELTERLNEGRVARWEADLPGPESRQALVALADMSAFLSPPVAEIPDMAAPDLAAQRSLMALTVDYVSKTMHQLPNFSATRNTTSFEDTPPRQLNTGGEDVGAFTPYQPLHPVRKSSTTELYRDGQEVVDSGAAKGKGPEAPFVGLTTRGEFGPILDTVLVDAAQGKLAWSHWELGAARPEAVFRYAIPREKSHYEVTFCCVTKEKEYRAFKQLSGYHGEIAVDPANGTILRMTLEADLKPADPIARADMLVEYGPIELGGTTYFCPVKSVSISRAPAQVVHAVRMQRFSSTLVEQNNQSIAEPLQTLLNDVVFDQYHLFRADVRVLTTDN
jgi:hypothetical protein